MTFWLPVMVATALVPFALLFVPAWRDAAQRVVPSLALADAAGFAVWLVGFVSVVGPDSGVQGAMWLWAGGIVAGLLGISVFGASRRLLERQGEVSALLVVSAAVSPSVVHGLVVLRSALIQL